jgi:hypothetical protein
MNFLKRLLGKGCSHRFSWPRIDTAGRHYQICLLCGTAYEYEYDWGLMRRTDRLMAADVQLSMVLAHASARNAKTL